MVVSVWPCPPITKEVFLEADMFSVASSPKQPSIQIAATTFSFADDDETYVRCGVIGECVTNSELLQCTRV